MSCRNATRQSGAAAVELIAALPLAGVLVSAVFQMALVGHAQWRLQEAARLAARESLVAARGDDKPAAAISAARRVAVAALGPQGRTLRLTQSRPGQVELSTELPLVEPYRGVVRNRPRIHARARFGR